MSAPDAAHNVWSGRGWSLTSVDRLGWPDFTPSCNNTRGVPVQFLFSTCFSPMFVSCTVVSLNLSRAVRTRLCSKVWGGRVSQSVVSARLFFLHIALCQHVSHFKKNLKYEISLFLGYAELNYEYVKFMIPITCIFLVKFELCCYMWT
jgi:hypothetical protein